MKYKSPSQGPIKSNMLLPSNSYSSPSPHSPTSTISSKPQSAPSSPEIQKKKRLKTLRQKAQSPKKINSSLIFIPEFKEILYTDLTESLSSNDLTESEVFEEIHNDLENNEYFTRARPEIRKVKANGKSTEKVHLNKKTEENLKRNLMRLGKLVPDEVMRDYLLQGVYYLPWICGESDDELEVTFNRF